MLTREDVSELLTLQATAYGLLMWLGQEGVAEPDLLSPESVALLRAPATAAVWLLRQRQRIPAALLPRELEGAFANLFASFFATSFEVKHLAMGGRLIDSRLVLGADADANSHVGLEQAQALALKHLAASEGIALDEKTARRLVRRATLRQASLVWAYVWELGRRAKSKGKGPVVHKIWRSIPWDTKKALSVEVVWEARAQLLTAGRAVAETADDETP